jgi:acyl CoA:acetate/3-ketoacid CoA transferase alpha subunit/acyl CoA:acetate/3-ketoacid CoA transferase beta subunit
MNEKVRGILSGTFNINKDEGKDKVIPLEEAIKQKVKPRMKLHIGDSANAAICEIIRQFWGTRPDFTLIASIIMDYSSDLIHCGLAKKVITSTCTELYPTPAPNRAVQRAYKEKNIQIENWSLYSIVQRLMAGALGVGFMPTKSIIGSSMALENQDSFQIIRDPFGGNSTIGVVKSLNPDLSLIHGWAADRYGNTVLAPPILTGEGIWGAAASTEGVVVTVEKLVSTDFIREHSGWLCIPGYLVSSVSVAPFGAHPQARINPGIKDFEAYGADYSFLAEHRKASRNSEAFDTWIKEWVLDCKNHENYLSKLGYERILSLKGKGDRDAWEYNLASMVEEISTHLECNSAERMIITAARKIKEIIRKHCYRIMLAGIGASGLAAWVAYYQLKKENYDVDLLIGSGLFGLVPRPADPQLASISHIPTCKIVTDAIDAYGVFVGGENSKCLSILGAGQIDKYGNINSTKVSDEVYLIGSGGSNDAANAREMVVVINQSPTRLVEKVPYITCPGKKVSTLISDMGIFEKLDGEELILTGYFPTSNYEKDIKRIKENCGWNLKLSPAFKGKEFFDPTLEELVTLRLLDPERHFTKD